MDEHDTDGMESSHERCPDCGNEECTCVCEFCGNQECTCVDSEENINDMEDRLNAIVELLVEKGILLEQEIEKKMESYYEDESEQTVLDSTEVKE